MGAAIKSFYVKLIGAQTCNDRLSNSGEQLVWINWKSSISCDNLAELIDIILFQIDLAIET